MAELYLIAHKVRGEPAFDIAINIHPDDDEPLWIIPTSGHRAYPYRQWLLDDLYDGSDMDMPKPTYVLDTMELPADLRDHYQADLDRTPDDGVGKSLLERLGLIRKQEPIRRRI